MPFLPLLNRKCRVGTGVGKQGSNIAEQCYGRMEPNEEERNRRASGFPPLAEMDLAFLPERSPLSLSRKVCASSFSSVLITPQFRSVGPSLVAPAPALPWSSPTSHQVHLGWGEVRGVAALH